LHEYREEAGGEPAFGGTHEVEVPFVSAGEEGSWPFSSGPELEQDVVVPVDERNPRGCHRPAS
jgi:hypothetical protein